MANIETEMYTANSDKGVGGHGGVRFICLACFGNRPASFSTCKIEKICSMVSRKNISKCLYAKCNGLLMFETNRFVRNKAGGKPENHAEAV